MINTYVRGTLVRCSVLFENAAGTDVDPTTVTFRFKTPAGATTSWVHGVDGGLVKDATGAYHADVDANDEGAWHYRWEGTGANQAAAEGQFTVIGGAFA
jgi:hypothetical protein